MISIDAGRFKRRFADMSAIARTRAGGVHRLALTEADKACRQLLFRWCEEAALEVKIDQIGNMFATRVGQDPHRAPLLVGSHLDSQPFAGAYDGPVGVLAALEVMEALNDRGLETLTPLQLVNWSNEEGARFRPPLVVPDYGLDAVHVWPSGEIWFSTEEGFQDGALGPIAAGDLLSDQGYVVYRNLELLGPFAPIEDLADFGLDALFLVSDAVPAVAQLETLLSELNAAAQRYIKDPR